MRCGDGGVDAAPAAVYAVYAISSLDTGSPLKHRTQNMQLRRDTPGSCRARSPALHVCCLLTTPPRRHKPRRPKMEPPAAKLPRTDSSNSPTLYAACLDQLGQFGNQVFQYAFALLYAEQWGLALRTPRWVGSCAFVGAAEPARSQPPLPPPAERLILADRVVLSHAGWKAWVESREPLASLVREAGGAPLSGRTLRRTCPQVNAAAVAPREAVCAGTGLEHVERCLAAGGTLELWGFFQFETSHFACAPPPPPPQPARPLATPRTHAAA